VHRGDNKGDDDDDNNTNDDDDDDDDDDNNNNNNNNNFQKYLQNIGSTKHILRVLQTAVLLPMCLTVRKFLGGAP
jgi:dynein heavy chain